MPKTDFSDTMLLADLPYSLSQFSERGLYGLLATQRSRVVRRSKPKTECEMHEAPPATEEDEYREVIKLRKKLTLCDAPTCWASCQDKGEPEPLFYPHLRLAGEERVIRDFLNSPQMRSWAETTGKSVPSFEESITERDGVPGVICSSDFSKEEVERLATEEYKKFASVSEERCSFESVETLLDSLSRPGATRSLFKEYGYLALAEFQAMGLNEEVIEETLGGLEIKRPKRGRKPKASPAESKSVPTDASHEAPKEKRKIRRKTLREQVNEVYEHPSRVVDVSLYGDSVRRKSGRILDRVKNADKIGLSTTIPGYPIISSNLPAFERALIALAEPRVDARAAEFRLAHQQRMASLQIPVSLSS